MPKDRDGSHCHGGNGKSAGTNGSGNGSCSDCAEVRPPTVGEKRTMSGVIKIMRSNGSDAEADFLEEMRATYSEAQRLLNGLRKLADDFENEDTLPPTPLEGERAV